MGKNNESTLSEEVYMAPKIAFISYTVQHNAKTLSFGGLSSEGQPGLREHIPAGNEGTPLHIEGGGMPT